MILFTIYDLQWMYMMGMGEKKTPPPKKKRNRVKDFPRLVALPSPVYEMEAEDTENKPTLANKQMPMSGPAYMHASIATPRLTANQHTGNGREHLHVVERPDVHIIFPSWYSSEYSLSSVIQHVNYTSTELWQRIPPIQSS